MAQQTPEMEWAIWITGLRQKSPDDPTMVERRWMLEDYRSQSKELAKQKADSLMEVEGIKAAEVKPMFSEKDLKARHKLWEDAVAEFGEVETFQMVERCVLIRQLSNKEKALECQQHPAFKVLEEHRQKRITFQYDRDEIMNLCRNLLSCLAVKHGLYPLSKNAGDNAIVAVTYKLKDVYARKAVGDSRKAERDNPQPKRRVTRVTS